MVKQYIFAFFLFVTLGIFSYTTIRLTRYFMLTKKAFPVRNIIRRIKVMFEVAFLQSRILRKPLIGPLHALVFWGFCVILIGSIEMVIDGLFGTNQVLQKLGWFYNFTTGSGDIFAIVIGIAIIIFLGRRLFLHVKRFEGIEMKSISHIDAKVALILILFLMISLQGMNISYLGIMKLSNENIAGAYPISKVLLEIFPFTSKSALKFWYEFFWWSHILTIFIFANYLPYSKHFHVFMSIPNVFLSRLDLLGKLPNMDNVTHEVRLMMDPNAVFSTPEQFYLRNDSG